MKEQQQQQIIDLQTKADKTDKLEKQMLQHQLNINELQSLVEKFLLDNK
jgi:hypothetical protein